MDEKFRILEIFESLDLWLGEEIKEANSRAITLGEIKTENLASRSLYEGWRARLIALSEVQRRMVKPRQ